MKKEIIKPFNLEAYKNGAKVKTRDGHEVRIICTDAKDENYPIIALIKVYNGDEVVVYYTLEGKINKGYIGNNDLVIVEEPEFWSDEENYISGFYRNASSGISRVNDVPNDEHHYDVFAIKKQVKSVIAMARISQIMANDIEHFGGVVTDDEWKDGSWKHVIYRLDNDIYVTSTNHNYSFLAFHTKAQRDLFLEKYRDLVKDYLAID